MLEQAPGSGLGDPHWVRKLGIWSSRSAGGSVYGGVVPVADEGGEVSCVLGSQQEMVVGDGHSIGIRQMRGHSVTACAMRHGL